MPSTRIYTRSFGGGEISPEMFGRIDDSKYQTGAALLRNFITKPQGPAYNRPGTLFVRATGNSAKKSRLIPFVFSTTQSVVIELGINASNVSFFRFYTNGAVLTAPSATAYKPKSTSVTFTAPSTVNWSGHTFVAGDPVFFTGANLPPELVANRVYYVSTPLTNTFKIAATSGGPELTFTTAASSSTGSYAYRQGELVLFSSRVYYYRNTQGESYDAPVTGPATSSPFWWLQPITGEYEIPTHRSDGVPYAEADIFSIHYAQSNDVLTLVHPNYQPMELRRYGATDWRMIPLTFQGTVATPTNVSVTANLGGAIEIDFIRKYEGNAAGGVDKALFTFDSDHGYANNDQVYISNCKWNFVNDKFFLIQDNDGDGGADATREVTLKTYDGGKDVNFNTEGSTFGEWLCTSDDTANTITTSNPNNLAVGCPVIFNQVGLNGVPSGVTAGTTYYVKALSPANATTFQITTDPNGTGAFVNIGTASGFIIRIGRTGKMQFSNPTINTVNKYKVSAIGPGLDESLASAEVSVTNNLYVTGAYNTISWDRMEGAVRYNVYKEQSGLFGYIGQVEQPANGPVTFKDDNIAPDLGQTPPLFSSDLQTSTNFPAAVCYYEQRRCFGGTITKPQAVWMTASGTESDLGYHLPAQDTDRIFFQVAARESNTIRHMVPLQQLVLLTNSAEWRVTSVNGDALTPFTISVRPQSFIGANNAQPQIINNTMVYVASRGGHVREMGYNWQANGYITGDLSMRAAHLFDDYDIVDMTYSKAPRPILWFISTSGKLLGMTYVPEEQVGAWHQHDTLGTFESCASVPEGDEDFLYVIVNRGTQASPLRYVERMQSREYATLADAWFMDSALQTTVGAGPVTSVGGLDHLNGNTVSVLVNGQIQPSKVVSGGSITLTTPATTGQKILVGLPITAELKTLPVTLQMEGFGQYRVKNVSKAFLRVLRSGDFYMGPSADKLVKSNPYNTSATMVSENVDVLLTPTWDWDGTVLVRQTDPLPLEITSLTTETVIGGG
jgi:hypothetical protein